MINTYPCILVPFCNLYSYTVYHESNLKEVPKTEQELHENLSKHKFAHVVNLFASWISVIYIDTFTVTATIPMKELPWVLL